jgi:hypothetical protein
MESGYEVWKATILCVASLEKPDFKNNISTNEANNGGGDRGYNMDLRVS